MNPPFVKKFDFRGVYGEDIKDENAYYLSLAILKTFSPKKILLAWDTREGSKNLAMHFIQGLENQDVKIFYMEKVSIDYLTAGSFSSDYDVSIMFTGSHNPWTWSGLLIHEKNGESIKKENVSKIIDTYNSIEKLPYEYHEINLSDYENVTQDVEEKISEKLNSLIPLAKIPSLEVVVDTGDGSGFRSLALLEKLLPQITFSKLHTRTTYDKNSTHIADPSEISNVADVLEEMKNNTYDAAFIFDSDADRVLSVDEKGSYINGSLLGSVHMESFCNLKLSIKNVGYAVDCGASMINTSQLLMENKYKVFTKPIPVGRSLVREELRKDLDLGVENVGHFYAKDFFMTDSAIFSVIIVLYWMSKYGKLSHVFTIYPDGKRGQIFTEVLEEKEIIELCKNLNENFETLRVEKITVDGVRFEFYQGKKLITWYTIRNSGYEKITKCYYGSLDKNDFTILDNVFSSYSKEKDK